jgi:divinyl chlorophyllide a 8-vinyl-reductase
MLVLNPETDQYDGSMTPGYGKDTLEGFFKKCVTEGMDGQELGDAAVFGQK